ncbi:hypothetical protein BT69DRAFT_1296755 [Atractiella rhizophila]|nr:hypothetical protein BT69DRAFT_1296755 [Atractiella rhizophila]
MLNHCRHVSKKGVNLQREQLSLLELLEVKKICGKLNFGFFTSWNEPLGATSAECVVSKPDRPMKQLCIAPHSAIGDSLDVLWRLPMIGPHRAREFADEVPRRILEVSLGSLVVTKPATPVASMLFTNKESAISRHNRKVTARSTDSNFHKSRNSSSRQFSRSVATRFCTDTSSDWGRIDTNINIDAIVLVS